MLRKMTSPQSPKRVTKKRRKAARRTKCSDPGVAAEIHQNIYATEPRYEPKSR